jgi:hypothetical protein
MRIEGGKFGPRELIAQRFPWLLRDPSDLSFLESYDVVLANSEYTRSWIQALWDTDPDVLFPPIQTERMHPAAEREKAVITVGRFFSPGLGHAKRQLEMVQLFGQAHRSGALPKEWKLYVVGGCEDSQRPYLAQVQAAGEGLPVEVIDNAPRETVEQLLSTSSVFWSGDRLRRGRAEGALGQRALRHDDGRVDGRRLRPRRHRQAGQKEIVREGVDGFRLVDARAAIALTARVAGDERCGRDGRPRPTHARRTTASRPSPTAGTRSPPSHSLLEADAGRLDATPCSGRAPGSAATPAAARGARAARTSSVATRSRCADG